VHAKFVAKQGNTCRISSKSLAASFFISETLFANRHMVSRLNVGMLWKLYGSLVRFKSSTRTDAPLIKFMHVIRVVSIDEMDEVREDGLPNA
jgi:hypothetical protein